MKKAALNLSLILAEHRILVNAPQLSVGVDLDYGQAMDISSMLEALTMSRSNEIRAKSDIDWPTKALSKLFGDRFDLIHEIKSELVVQKASFFWELTHPRAGRVRTTPTPVSVIPSLMGVELPGSNVRHNRRIDAREALINICMTATATDKQEVDELRHLLKGLVQRVGYEPLMMELRHFRDRLSRSNNFFHLGNSSNDVDKLDSIIVGYLAGETKTPSNVA